MVALYAGLLGALARTLKGTPCTSAIDQTVPSPFSSAIFPEPFDHAQDRLRPPGARPPCLRVASGNVGSNLPLRSAVEKAARLVREGSSLHRARQDTRNWKTRGASDCAPESLNPSRS